MTSSALRIGLWPAVLLLTIGTACSDSAEPTTLAPAATTTAPVSTIATTVAPPATTSAPAPRPIDTTFVQIAEDDESWMIEIFYPRIVLPDAEVAAAVNVQIDTSLRAMADRFKADSQQVGPDGQRSTLVAQIAPELLSPAVFSLSGVVLEFDGADGTSRDRRVGWMFELEQGTAVSAEDLFLGGDLERIAESARNHLAADVFADEASITAPAGLLPTPANFDAVWLTATGIGVGFDQYQVAGGEAGTPAVLIPFSEFAGVLNTAGILAPLRDRPTLPEL